MSAQPRPVDIQIVRSTGGVETVLDEFSTTQGIVAFPYQDNPPAGTHIYYMRVKQATLSPSAGYSGRRSIVAAVLKK